MNRRKLLLGIAVAPLAGCNAAMNSFANRAFNTLVVVAKKLEYAIKLAAKDMSAAVAYVAGDVVPVCRLFVAITKLAGQVAAVNPKLQQNTGFMAVMGQASVLASNDVVQAAAQNGVAPTDPVTVLTGIIQLSAQIYDLTHGAATPTKAAEGA
jgi:hypothetical protein